MDTDDIRTAIKKSLVLYDTPVCRVDSARFKFSHGWGCYVDAYESRIVEVSFMGTLSAPGVDALHGLRCLASFNNLDWWDTVKTEAGVGGDAEAVGALSVIEQFRKVEHRSIAPVMVGIYASPDLMTKAYDFARMAMAPAIANVWISFQLNLDLPAKGRDGRSLERVWIKHVELEVRGNVNYVDPRT